MQLTLQRIIKKLELNESAISTIIGGIALLIVSVLFVGYFKDYKSAPVIEPKPDITSSETITTKGEISLNEAGQTSSAATSKYKVQANESLWTIAQREYQDGYKWVEIAQANQLVNPDLITEGMMLDLPRASDIGISEIVAPDLAVEETEKVIPTTQEETDLKTYTVVNNDSLWKISQNVYNDGYKWSQIWQLNQEQIQNPDILPVGLVLKLPAK